MKVKSELQGASPDIREIQITLKRFILDLDVKEAYEFSILNSFLINEEELNNLVAELGNAEGTLHGYRSTDGAADMMRLDLHPPMHNHSSEEDNDDEEDHHTRFNFKQAVKDQSAPSKRGRDNYRKSLMNTDLDRLANEAQSRGE